MDAGQSGKIGLSGRLETLSGKSGYLTASRLSLREEAVSPSRYTSCRGFAFAFRIYVEGV